MDPEHGNIKIALSWRGPSILFLDMYFLEGRLHVYSSQYGALTMFESGYRSSSSTVLFIPGLTEVGHLQTVQLISR